MTTEMQILKSNAAQPGIRQLKAYCKKHAFIEDLAGAKLRPLRSKSLLIEKYFQFHCMNVRLVQMITADTGYFIFRQLFILL